MRKNLGEALTDWAWLLNTDDMEIIRTTSLGDVILRSNMGKEIILLVGAGEFRPYDQQERELLSGEGDFIARMESHGMKLSPGQCYGLKPHAVFKDYVPENIYVATLTEYVSYMGCFYEQIKDLPDGASIRLKVKSE